MKVKLSLEAQLGVRLVALITATVFIVTLFNYWLGDALLAALFSSVVTLPVALIILHAFMEPINRILMALTNGFHNFLDNDFSISVAKTRDDELGSLVQTYNRVGEALRDERLHLYQRELLLDSVIQTTPLSLILVDDSDAIIYSNSAARKLFNEGKPINGIRLSDLQKKLPEPFTHAINSGLNGLFTLNTSNTNEIYHLTQNQFQLNGRKHHLYLFKSLTKEISRQEVNTWKKVIRLISHELNNSLAPITSLAHSGQLLSERTQEQKLKDIFSTIEERARYLQYFIEGYAEFARLPKPRIEAIEAKHFLKGLTKIKPFKISWQSEDLEDLIIYCDPIQLQQVIINLVKNAHESGSEINSIQLGLKIYSNTFEIQITDRGKGMSEQHLNNALLPFYSTKAEGSGLGLPLCREIVEAHGGKIIINNRPKGGLKVILIFPNISPKQVANSD